MIRFLDHSKLKHKMKKLNSRQQNRNNIMSSNSQLNLLKTEENLDHGIYKLTNNSDL